MICRESMEILTQLMLRKSGKEEKSWKNWKILMPYREKNGEKELKESQDRFGNDAQNYHRYVKRLQKLVEKTQKGPLI